MWAIWSIYSSVDSRAPIMPLVEWVILFVIGLEYLQDGQIETSYLMNNRMYRNTNPLDLR